MDALRRKLNDQRGVSLLMALLLMLVSLTVSAVVIAAASGAVSALHTDRAQEQAALTVTSAADLIRSSFLSEDMKYTVTATAYEYTYYPSRNYTDEVSTPISADAAFSGFANYAVEQLRKSQTVLPRVYTLHLEDEHVSDVQVTLSMRYEALSSGQYSYVLTAALESLDEDAPYRMTLVMPSTVDESEPITSTRWDWTARDYCKTTVITTTVHWTDGGTIQRKEGA